MFPHLTIPFRELVDEVSADSGLQLDLEIALNGGPSSGSSPTDLFSPADHALKQSGDVNRVQG